MSKIAEKYQSIKNTGMAIPTFTKWLNENPDYEDADCYFGDEELAKLMGLDTALEVFSLNGLMNRGTTLVNVFTKNPDVNKLMIIHEPNKKGIYIGGCYDGAFSVIGKMMYKDTTLFPNALEVYKVIVHSSRFDEGIATALYQSILNAGFTIISDNYQYKGAKGLWKRLYGNESWKYTINGNKIHVGIYDTFDHKWISKDARNIKDQDIWNDVTSGGESKAHIRLVAQLGDFN
jgi:hypothetical protein